MAAVLLKKYVDTHWSSDSEKFQVQKIVGSNPCQGVRC
jgi:hypothetical protein